MTKRFKEDPNGDWEMSEKYQGEWAIIRRVEEPMPEIRVLDAIKSEYSEDKWVTVIKVYANDVWFHNSLSGVEVWCEKSAVTAIKRDEELIWERKR